MRKGMLGIAATTAVVALTVTATAFARAGDRTFAETYPVASALCVKAKAGTLPPKLATPSASASVTAACETLANPYPTLVSTVDAAEDTLLNTISAEKTAVAKACPKPVTNPSACKTARATAKSTIAAARTTEQTAVTAYHTAIEANRVTFWNTISALR
jgi:hypothetical protein